MKKVIVAILMMSVMLFMFIGCGEEFDETSEVVVIGAGGGGLSAAVEAVENDAEVILLEKMPAVGGNTMRATGGMNAAGTVHQEALGINDDVETHYDDTMEGGGHLNNPDLVEVMTSQAPDAIKWLGDLGADLTDVGGLGGHSNNRSHRPEGGAAVGYELVSTLEDTAREAGVDIRTRNKVTAVAEKNEDGLFTIEVEAEDDTYTIGAEAVVVAAGGFGACEDRFVEFDSSLEGFGTTNNPAITGDYIDFLAEKNVSLIDMEEIQEHPTVEPETSTMITEAVRGNGAILSNLDGERFIDELETRDVVSEAILEQAESTSYLIFDQDVRDGLSAIESYVEQGLVIEGDTISELAEEVGIDAANLEDTLDRYNDFVADDEDPDYNRSNLAAELDEAPYYAIEVAPAVHHTMGGVEITPEAEILAEDGSQIEGLYAAGETTGGVHGNNRLGGNALADIVVFGRIAGTNAAESIK